MVIKVENLIKLAQADKFELSNSELKLLQSLADGEDADYQTGDSTQDDPANYATWGENRIVRASLLVWLCTDQEICWRLPYIGLSITGARIKGSFDLSFIKLEVPLIISF